MHDGPQKDHQEANDFNAQRIVATSHCLQGKGCAYKHERDNTFKARYAESFDLLFCPSQLT